MGAVTGAAVLRLFPSALSPAGVRSAAGREGCFSLRPVATEAGPRQPAGPLRLVEEPGWLPAGGRFGVGRLHQVWDCGVPLLGVVLCEDGVRSPWAAVTKPRRGHWGLTAAGCPGDI